MNLEFQKILNFKGYGNPINSIWFIGVEEALEYEKGQTTQSYHKEFIISKKGDYLKEKEKFKIEHPKNRYTSVYEILGKIISKNLEIELMKYLNELIFTKDGNCFLTNYYPLGKKNMKTQIPEKYFDWFEIKSKKEYEFAVRENRGNELYRFWRISKPRATIAFGKSNWNQIIESFKLEEFECEEFGNNMRIYPDLNFYLCPFFVNHQMSTEKIEILVKRMKTAKNRVGCQ